MLEFTHRGPVPNRVCLGARPRVRLPLTLRSKGAGNEIGSMDLFEAIQKLYAEKESLLRAIAALEALQASEAATVGVMTKGNRSRRGRKSMNPEERQEVSLRMKKYWASRRTGHRGPAREDNGH